jgi:hypothetical protein
MNSLNSYLCPGPENTASDMHIQSGYPIWNLIANWITHNYDEGKVIADYSLDPAEWQAAKDFYEHHKAMIDAKIILNQEPIGDLVEDLNTPDEFFAWTQSQRKAS